MSPLLELSRPGLLNLAAAFDSGRLGLPVSAIALTPYVPTPLLTAIHHELNQLHQELAITKAQLSYMLRLMASERARTQAQRDRIDLVWSGTEVLGSESRDTRVVVQELFNRARYSVLIATFAIDSGPKAKALFQGLADRMDDNPHLNVRMFLNVHRPYGDRQSTAVLLKQFAQDFRENIWPGQRLPDVFHDPRSLSLEPGPRSCLHTKCVVVDNKHLLVTSANFTEAAHERNLEAGMLVDNPVAAQAMRSQFDELAKRKLLLPVFDLSD